MTTDYKPSAAVDVLVIWAAAMVAGHPADTEVSRTAKSVASGALATVVQTEMISLPGWETYSELVALAARWTEDAIVAHLKNRQT